MSCNDVVEYLCLHLLTLVIDNSFNSVKWDLTELTSRSTNLILLASGIVRYCYTCTSIPYALAVVYIVACSSAFWDFWPFVWPFFSSCLWLFLAFWHFSVFGQFLVGIHSRDSRAFWKGGGLSSTQSCAYPYTNFRKCRLHCLLAQANLFTIFIVSGVSVIDLWQCISSQLFRHSCVMVLLR